MPTPKRLRVKTPVELATMRESGRRLATALDVVLAAVRPGVTTLELDAIAEREIRAGGDVPSFKGYHDFPASICASVNDEVVHGIPTSRVLHDGDIIGIDIGLVHGGYHSDMAVTVGIGAISAENERLLRVTESALALAITALRPGVRIGIVGATVQPYVEGEGFGVVRALVGHGIGQQMHEDPSIPNYGPAEYGPVIQAGMTFALEPMVAAGGYRVQEDDDGWTVRTVDGSMAAHFEHTVVVTKDGAEILTKV